MRVTGAADPTKSQKETMEGKLSQRKIVTGAAKGYSSYGNQIGLATGLVDEVYHPNYVAKRLEIGAVMGAAPRKNVIRENSDPDDIIILLGGRTGRDGCGGATGSSKAHNTASIDTCGAEVQKGNAPTERKIQRLFRREEVSRLIKKRYQRNMPVSTEQNLLFLSHRSVWQSLLIRKMLTRCLPMQKKKT